MAYQLIYSRLHVVVSAHWVAGPRVCCSYAQAQFGSKHIFARTTLQRNGPQGAPPPPHNCPSFANIDIEAAVETGFAEVQISTVERYV